ncbi:uncharacterized protein RSE6_14426 [Rhynchosporium secalis]|uniref:Uncharacterized protein n=1 Tax=Rhynchosporium secalis TaxID=38038 RepID=A0A1E1MV93_RHYSE|nr:uncharacterized protein RSE6_14426 [Rhynchosporium secalis]
MAIIADWKIAELLLFAFSTTFNSTIELPHGGISPDLYLKSVTYSTRNVTQIAVVKSATPQLSCA